MPAPAVLSRLRTARAVPSTLAAVDTRHPPAAAPLAHRSIALGEKARAVSVDCLNRVLADTITLRDLYKKHHWQVNGATFYQLHLLYDKHYAEQAGLADVIAERVQMLGGNTVAMAADVVRLTIVAAAPMEREEPEVQLQRLLTAHEQVIAGIRAAARDTEDAGDLGSTDLLSGAVLQTNELQSWFIGQHLPEASRP